jgi:Uma2 family endonuclease
VFVPASIAAPITVEQYEHFEGYPGLRDELINGRIVLSPQPKPLHQEVVENFRRLLDAALSKSEYIVRQNSNIRFKKAHTMPAPDLFVVRREVWLAAIKANKYLAEAPLIAIEVLSRANREKGVEDKTRVYLSNGVQHVWIADPKKGEVYIARLLEDRVEREPVETITVKEPVRLKLAAAEILAIK